MLLNFALETGLKGRAWLRPLTRGAPDAVAALEPVRQRLMSGGGAAAQGAKRHGGAPSGGGVSVPGRVGAREALDAQRKTLEDMGRREWAMEGAQVWNRIIQALDQAHELLAGEPLTARALYELLRRALGAAEIKALPQSGDAVMGGGLDHMKGRPVKALFILGATDMAPGAAGALLSERELGRLTERGLCLASPPRPLAPHAA
jgi:hypothetical protein